MQIAYTPVNPDMMTILGGGALRTSENVLFEPFVTAGSVGYIVTAPDGTTRIIRLIPSTSHEVNPDNEALADVFVYDDPATSEWLVEQDPFEVVTYINLFTKE